MSPVQVLTLVWQAVCFMSSLPDASSCICSLFFFNKQRKPEVTIFWLWRDVGCLGLQYRSAMKQWLPSLHPCVCSDLAQGTQVENVLLATEKPKLSQLCSPTLSSKIRNSRALARCWAGLKGDLAFLCKILNRRSFDQQKISWVLPGLRSVPPFGKRP